MNVRNILIPRTLDIIKVDNRWAQVGSSTTEEISMFYLENKILNRINPAYYELTKLVNLPIYLLPKDLLSKTEINNVRWGPEQEDFPELKMQVNVFGVYEIKSKLISLCPSFFLT